MRRVTWIPEKLMGQFKRLYWEIELCYIVYLCITLDQLFMFDVIYICLIWERCHCWCSQATLGNIQAIRGSFESPIMCIIGECNTQFVSSISQYIKLTDYINVILFEVTFYVPS